MIESPWLSGRLEIRLLVTKTLFNQRTIRRAIAMRGISRIGRIRGLDPAGMAPMPPLKAGLIAFLWIALR